MNQQILEPLKFYTGTGRQLHADNTSEYFESLVTTSGIDVEANRATSKAYESEVKKIDEISKKIKKYKIFRIISIVLIVLGALAAICGGLTYNWVMLAIGAVVAIAMVILIFAFLNKKIKSATAIRDELSQKAAKLLAEAEEQMAPLNALFSEKDTFDLIEKTVPDFSFLHSFTRTHERLMTDNYGFYPATDNNSSAFDTVQGTYLKNPFVYCRNILHRLGVETYHGTLVISWTETERDSDGRIRTVRRTETLHASVTKPKPFYSHDTYLIYGSHAAPDLSFSRGATHAEDLSEKQIEKKVKKGKKKLEKKAQKARKKGGSFQEMSNAEFEVLFGATDRDNEVQFRMMYTPLAQINTVDLITSEDGYGDDFAFRKAQKKNVIRSEHMQKWNMRAHPSNYYSYSVDIARNKFESFNNEYFKSIFFDFAPLMAVPIYNEEPPSFLIEENPYLGRFATFEHESAANLLGYENFTDYDSRTQAILKTSFISSDGVTDKVAVTAYSYTTAERLDLIPVFGGDGRMHAVPVPWTEYIPVSRTSSMSVTADEDGILRASIDY